MPNQPSWVPDEYELAPPELSPSKNLADAHNFRTRVKTMVAKLKNNQKKSVSKPTKRAKPLPKAGELSAQEQRLTILSSFFDDDDPDNFLALIKHCRIDLSVCDGDAKKIPSIIAAHYRLKRGQYDIERAANDLLTFPPIAAHIKELKAKRAKVA